MSKPLILVVSVWLRDGNIAAFEAFEHQTALLMTRFGGKIERAIRSSQTDNQPFETHVVSFPDHAHFVAYREDAEVRRLAAQRSEIIARTRIVQGQDVEVY